MSNKVDLVLLQSMKWLWNKDDIVSVAIPYAKNVLLAQGKAKVADKLALDTMKQKKDKQQKHEKELTDAFAALQQWVSEGWSVKIAKKATPQWHLYEKVGAKDIQQAIASASKVLIDLTRISINGKIESIGETSVTVTYKGKKIIVPITIH